MPRYDYKCLKCGDIGEVIAPIDTLAFTCQICGATAERLFSPSGQSWKLSDKEFIKRRDEESQARWAE